MTSGSGAIAGLGVGPAGQPGVSVSAQRRHQQQNADAAPIMGNIMRRKMLDTNLAESILHIIRKRKKLKDAR